MKSTTFGPWKAKDKEDDQSYGLDVDQGFLYGFGFLILVASNEMMPHMSRDHESWVAGDGNHAMVLNSNEMIFTSALVIRASVRVLKPHGDDEKLDI